MTTASRILPVVAMAATSPAALAQFAGFTPDIITLRDSVEVGSVVDMTIGDVDADGVNDIVYLTDLGRVQYYPGAASGQLTDAAVSIVDPDSGTGRAIDLFDCDGDNLPDLMRADSRDGGSLRIYKNVGGGQFVFDFAIINLGAITESKGLSMGDFDADGDADAYVLTDTGVTVVINDGGSFNFNPVVSSFINFDGRRLAVADIDGDGRDDAVSYSTLNSQIYVLEAGPFGLTDVARLDFADDLNDLKLFDIDQDNDPDLVATGEGAAGLLEVYRNSSGEFDLLYSTTENYPDETEIADIDADGDLDLIVECSANFNTSERAIIYSNNGSGFFDRLSDEWFFDSSTVQQIEVADIASATGIDLIGITGAFNAEQRVTLRLNATPFDNPGPFAQVSPADGAVDVAPPTHVDAWGNAAEAELRWERARGLGITYTVRLDDNVDFSSPVYEASGIDGKAADLSGVELAQGTTYFWEVEATNAFGTTLSTNGPFSFVTSVGPSDCPADINGDGLLDQGDITTFVALFLAGC
ncbi:MAG: FG-GAP repeat domain-containing protein [Phycisphaerales bacterium JB040]